MRVYNLQHKLTQICMHAHPYTHIHTIHIHTYMYVCVRAYLCVPIRVCVLVCVYIKQRLSGWSCLWFEVGGVVGGGGGGERNDKFLFHSFSRPITTSQNKYARETSPRLLAHTLRANHPSQGYTNKHTQTRIL